jgi:hypothetical protein
MTLMGCVISDIYRGCTESDFGSFLGVFAVFLDDIGRLILISMILTLIPGKMGFDNV